MKLRISKEISLPLEVITQTIAILAKRRAGKSYTMRKLVEQLLTTGQQVCLIDPKGDQWGIRSSSDGKSAGFPIVILGGEHGDAPLEPSAGEVVAKLVVQERVSVLLDLSFFRKHEVATFMAAFLENLYRLKAQEAYRTPMMLVIDEADAIAPQKPQRGEERMLGAAEDIVRRGGQRGIGCALITQRSAVLNKNVLTQAQMLIVLRTIAPQDLAAMKAWIDVHGTIEQGKELMDSLPALPTGDAWFWSPGWPTEEGIFKRAHVLPIETFDSGATPKPGERPVVPKNLADVDLEALKKQMAATIEKAKAEDPKLLRKEVARLTAELAKKLPVENVVRTKVEKIEVPAVGKRTLEGLKRAESSMRKILSSMRDTNMRTREHLVIVEKHFERFSAELARAEEKKASSWSHTTSGSERIAVLENKQQHVPVPPERTRFDSSPALQDGEITGPEQRVLDALAWCESIGNMNPPNELVAFLSGYSHFRSTGYTNPRGYLKSKGLLTYTGRGVSLMPEGRILAIVPETPLTQETLHKAVLDRLDGPAKKLLGPLLKAHPNAISNADLCAQAGYMHERSTGYTNPRGRLRSFGLAEYNQDGVRASDILFI